MNGVHAAVLGRVLATELCYTGDGTPVCNVRLAVRTLAQTGEDAAPREELGIAVYGAPGETLAPRLSVGTELYAEGRLKHTHWRARSGEARCGLTLTAWVAVPLALVGARLPGSPIATAVVEAQAEGQHDGD